MVTADDLVLGPALLTKKEKPQRKRLTWTGEGARRSMFFVDRSHSYFPIHLFPCHKRRKQVPSRSDKVVSIGLFANVAIAVCKYVAGGVTGSPAMMSEAFHSTADVGNELLLLLGMRRSRRPPDALHPFGHGKLLYFYSLLVAVYIFGVGGGLAAYEGILHLQHPELSTQPIWNYCVLALAAVLDFYSWLVSYRELLARKDPNESTWDEIIGSKDPAVFTVFLEDSAGLIGVLLAFFGIFFGQVFHNPYFDPIASLLIALLLTAVALLLGRETGALLAGERTNRSRLKQISGILASDPAVERIGNLLSMQLGANQVLLTVRIKFRAGYTLEQIEAIIARLKQRVQQPDSMMMQIFIEPARLDDETQNKSIRPAEAA
jgi:cation diffusion facilitator family transporter